MSIYAIGDLHLSMDERIEKPMDIFGESWSDHPARVRENWLNTVRPEDTVIIPGDISWGLKLDEALADLEWVHELPGFKVLTKGNHDLWWTSVGRLNTLYDDMLFLQNHAYHVPGTETWICGTRGWNCPGSDEFTAHDRKIYQREAMRLSFSLEEAVKAGASDIIAALHYPPTNDKFQESEFTRRMSEAGVNTCIYGHLHGNENFRRGIKGYFNGVHYKLVSLDSVQCRLVKIR